MRVTIKKWGNSASVRIPNAVMKAAKLDVDQVVEIREDRGRVIIQPPRETHYDLRELVDAITPENRHDQIDFGKPKGKEAW
jgi:antitoxin MazE